MALPVRCHGSGVSGHAVSRSRQISEVRDLLTDALNRAHYPVLDLGTRMDSDLQVEMGAAFVPTAVREAAPDFVVPEVEASPLGISAARSVGPNG